MSTEQAGPLSRAAIRYGLLPRLTDPAGWYRAAMIIAACLFVHSLLAAGPAWDEPEEFGKLKSQLTFAADVLSGKRDLTFRSLPADSAYYGTGTVLIPYALSYLIEIGWLKRPVHNYEHSYSLILHFLTFLCSIAAVAYTRRLVASVTESRDVGLFAGLALLLTPFWIGYGFFDYKDIPVATGVIAATYYAAAYFRDGSSRTSLCFFLALFFIGVQKFAAMPLALPAGIAVTVAAARQAAVRRFTILASQAAAFLLLLYVATPPAWLEPGQFAVASLIYSSQHKWGGCTLTAGQCIGREVANGEGYSVLRYLGLWYGAKLPAMIWVGLIASVYFYVRRFSQLRAGHHLLVAALCWPVLAMAVRDSTLYDGIRHTLFLVPLAVAAVFAVIPGAAWLRLRWWLAVYFLFLVFDSLKLQPYQYVWFNEAGRFFANEKNYETDYWGYSLREAVALARNRQGPSDWIVGPTTDVNPSHLVRIYATDRFASSAGLVPPGATYYVVRTTRMNRPPPEQCDRIEYVARREFLAPHPLRLSFVTRCEGRRQD